MQHRFSQLLMDLGACDRRLYADTYFAGFSEPARITKNVNAAT